MANKSHHNGGHIAMLDLDAVRVPFDEATNMPEQLIQEINEISNRTATYELKELVENFNVLKISGASVGTFYEFP
jgi:hypothetical protein